MLLLGFGRRALGGALVLGERSANLDEKYRESGGREGGGVVREGKPEIANKINK